MRNRKLDRRLFLRGLGGAAIAAPFLSTLGVRSAVGQAPAAAAKRVILYFTHYGCITDKWFPESAHGPLTAADFEGKSIAALAPFAAKALIPRGLRGMNEWSFGREFGQETDPHAQVMASYLTAAPVDRTSSGQVLGGGLSFDKLSAFPYGRSLDHAIADQLNPTGVGPMVAHLDGVKTDSTSTLSYSAPLEPYRGVGTAEQMFLQLTNLGAAPSGELMNEDTYRLVVRGENAPDLVREQLTWLTNQRMSQADKDKLSHWIELTSQTSSQVRSALCTEEAAAAAGLSSSGADSFPAKVPGMMDLAVMNAMCNQSAIQLLIMPGNKSNFVDGVTGENHSLSHRVGSSNMGGACVNGVLDMLELTDIWYAGQFAYLAERLDGIQETESSTLLDNSATVWLMEQSDGQAHNTNNLPVLQLGGLGGHMKVGQAVNVEDGSPTMSNGNSSGQCGEGDDGDIAFDEIQSTGTDNTIANVPMVKYFYTLMNGLGVKANADGFPEVGGTHKVSKYGWSDDPQQFAEFVPNGGQGIADKPQGTFIDPGELESLLA